MRLLTDSLKVTNLPFPETLILTSKAKVEVDPSDDLNRETALSVIYLAGRLGTRNRKGGLADDSAIRLLWTKLPMSASSAKSTISPFPDRTTTTPRWSSRTTTWSASEPSWSRNRMFASHIRTPLIQNFSPVQDGY
jgi:hypothetical protein